MHKTTKIATCCYCGTRSTLVLGRDRHELTCGSCGAALHDLKSLPTPTVKPAKAKSHPKAPGHWHDRPLKRRKKKKKKSGLSRFLNEAWDVLDDIID